MAGSPVLVITAAFDPTADLVLEQLHARGVSFVRVDTAWFPDQLTLVAITTAKGWSGTMTTVHREPAIGDIRSVYWRRPTAYRPRDDQTGPELRFITDQAKAGLCGILLSAPGPWINNPLRMADVAGFKPLQLAAAQRAGLKIPRTIVTNSPTAAREFAASVSAVITKPIGKPTTDDRRDHFIVNHARIDRHPA